MSSHRSSIGVHGAEASMFAIFRIHHSRWFRMKYCRKTSEKVSTIIAMSSEEMLYAGARST